MGSDSSPFTENFFFYYSGKNVLNEDDNVFLL